ncbi:MAG: FAD-dependent oxidoreductase [Cytophagales bacterium]|nr:FAD-dependent oxidoreductase [Cytophagales bacterium]
MEHIVIIGNGIAGITAARHIRKNSDHKITVISGETDHFFSRTALMYIYMGHMKYEHTKPYEDWFWKKNRIELLRAWVKDVDFDTKKLTFESGDSVNYDKLILATGSKSNKFGWPGQDLNGVQGLYNLQDLESMEVHTKGIERAVIVGGGLIGIEMAEMLHSRHIPVTMLVREQHFWGPVLPLEEAQMINRHILEHGIDLRLDTELKEIVDDGNGNVKAVTTSSGETIPCQFVGLTVGVSPNVAFLQSTNLEIDKGIVADEYLETNQEDVFAIGDCTQLKNPPTGRRSIEAVWYVGRMMGETVAKTVTGSRTKYEPGVWFNSAKFLDLEYQTYGQVSPNRAQNEGEFYWEHPDGKMCLRLVFDKVNHQLIGCNNFGIRMRHEVFNRWITTSKNVEYALGHLKDANFDPEFYKQHEGVIVEKFNRENGTSIQVKKKSWKRILEMI